MKILPYNRLYTNSAKQNFNSICTVKSAVVDGKFYGQAQETTLNQAAGALSSSMHNKTLYGEALKEAYEFFPDLKKSDKTTVACSHIRKNRVNILVGNDAIRYDSCFPTPIRSDAQREKALNTITDIIYENNPKSICIYATKMKNGKLNINKIVDASTVSKDNY